MAPRSDDERLYGKSVANREAQRRRLLQLIEQADKLLDRLKVEWEKYILGIEKLPPEPLMRDARRLFVEIEKNKVMKTALKFRVQVLKDRWTSLRLYWMRTQHQIENGTHYRLKRRLSLQEREQALKDRLSKAPDPGARAGEGETEAPAPAAPTGGGSSEAPPPRPPDSADLFKDFIRARARCGQPVQGITPERLSQQLRTQAERIRQSTGREVHFRVVIEDGKPKVKAVPMKP